MLRNIGNIPDIFLQYSVLVSIVKKEVYERRKIEGQYILGSTNRGE